MEPGPVNPYSAARQQGTMRVHTTFPIHDSKLPILHVTQRDDGTAKYMKPQSVPARSFSPNDFNFLKQLDIIK